MNRYTVYITPDALDEIKRLPGNMRQRAKRTIDGFTNEPRPSGSKKLELPDYEVWRLRLDKWRIVYMISDSEKAVDVLAIRKRPPYDYGDLEKLLADLQ